MKYHKQLKTCKAVLLNDTMTTPATDGKMLVNSLYHSAVVSGLAMGYAKLGQMVFKGSLPKLDFTGKDIMMVVFDVGAGLATMDFLVKQGVIPADILK